jgi:AbrB family looped-hinge helix DNA binding protein
VASRTVVHREVAAPQSAPVRLSLASLDDRTAVPSAQQKRPSRSTEDCCRGPLTPNQLFGNIDGMRSTIDKAGRLVIPKALRDSIGLVAGEVEVTSDGAGLRIEPLADDQLEDEDGLLVIPAADATVGDDLIRTLRDADQR